MNKFVVLGSVLMAFALSGCETMNKVGESIKSIEMPKITPKGAADTASADSSGLLSVGGESCPQVKGLVDLAMITQFADAALTTPDTMVSDTKLEKIGSTCVVAGNSVSVELELNFTGVLGPAGVKDLDGQANYTYPYFISVISPDGKILSKDVFALSMIYENGQITYHKQDKLRQVIPLLSGQDASKFQIMIGFQLSEAELAYNRTKSPLAK